MTDHFRGLPPILALCIPNRSAADLSQTRSSLRYETYPVKLAAGARIGNHQRGLWRRSMRKYNKQVEWAGFGIGLAVDIICNLEDNDDDYDQVSQNN